MFSVISDSSKGAFERVSPNFCLLLPTLCTCYARRSLRITHGPKHYGAAATLGATTSSVCNRRVQPPLCCVCIEFVTKRIVPVLSSDCTHTHTHTCEFITCHLNIHLPTENVPLILILAALLGSRRDLYSPVEQ